MVDVNENNVMAVRTSRIIKEKDNKTSKTATQCSSSPIEKIDIWMKNKPERKIKAANEMLKEKKSI